MSSFHFLTLAPTTSASYPATPAPSSPASKVAGAEEFDEATLKSRRSSSSSSAASGKLRFLKLGPVHFGQGDGLGDWSDAIAE